MFSMLTGSLSSAISRFITYELGTGNQVKLKKNFFISCYNPNSIRFNSHNTS